jgi:ATP-dependent protease ClpP protease subunit
MAGGFPQPQPQPKPYFIGFNFFIDRLAIMKLIAAVNSTVNLQAQSVTLCISSNGGSTEQAFYAYEVLRALPVPINTINMSIVHSAANIIFMAGERRSATPESYFLFHQTKFTPGPAGTTPPPI